MVSGFYLWWPRNWTPAALRSVTLFRRRLSGKSRDFNWHNVVGFWSAVPLAVVVASGVVISYRWAGNLVYRSVGEVPPAAAPAPPAASQREERAPMIEGIDALFAKAEQRMPGWTSITAQLPAAGAKTMTFSLDRWNGRAAAATGEPDARPGNGE